MKALLVELPAGTELLRGVRHLPAGAFDTCSTDELRAAARWLRAAAYSAAEGARNLDRLIDQREGIPECSSDPSATPTVTAEASTSSSTSTPTGTRA